MGNISINTFYGRPAGCDGSSFYVTMNNKQVHLWLANPVFGGSASQFRYKRSKSLWCDFAPSLGSLLCGGGGRGWLSGGLKLEKRDLALQ